MYKNWETNLKYVYVYDIIVTPAWQHHNTVDRLVASIRYKLKRTKTDIILIRIYKYNIVYYFKTFEIGFGPEPLRGYYSTLDLGRIGNCLSPVIRGCLKFWMSDLYKPFFYVLYNFNRIKYNILKKCKKTITL
jgi:hypothetical protein